MIYVLLYKMRCCLPKELLQDPLRVHGADNSVSSDRGVVKDLIVVATFESLVAEKVNSLEVLVGNVAKAISLVPASGKDIK